MIFVGKGESKLATGGACWAYGRAFDDKVGLVDMITPGVGFGGGNEIVPTFIQGACQQEVSTKDVDRKEGLL